MKDTEEVSLPPIHGVEADGDVVQKQLPADPAHLSSSSPSLRSRHMHVCPLELATTTIFARNLSNLLNWLEALMQGRRRGLALVFIEGTRGAQAACVHTETSTHTLDCASYHQLQLSDGQVRSLHWTRPAAAIS